MDLGELERLIFTTPSATSCEVREKLFSVLLPQELLLFSYLVVVLLIPPSKSQSMSMKAQSVLFQETLS
jgi:hypothetical protein